MQRELFGSAAASVSFPDSTTSRISFLDRYRMTLRLDQALFLLIGLLVIYVLVFSFGVETGKRYAQDELRSERLKREKLTEELRGKVIANMEGMAAVASAKTTAPSVTVAEKKTAVSEMKTVPAASQPVQSTAEAVTAAQPTAGKYTIQILTIGSKAAAEKEVKRLIEKGLSAFILTRGKLSEVCVNGFESNRQASNALKELKTQGVIPADAYVRAMPVS